MYRKLFSLIMLTSISVSAGAVSLCKKPEVSGAYTLSPNCKAGQPVTQEDSPHVAILEAIIDQSDRSDIFNSTTRLIDFPVGQAFKWYLSDGDPSTIGYVNIKPVIVGGAAKFKITLNLSGVSQVETESAFSAVEAPPNSCTGNILSGFVCDNINDFFAKIKIFDADTISLFLELPEPIMTVNTQANSGSESDGAYLSVTYIQTCSGGLIAEDKIFTAAHCYYDWDNDSSSYLWNSANSHKQYIVGNNWTTSKNIATAVDTSPSSGYYAPNFIVPDKQKPSTTDEQLKYDYAIVDINQKFTNIKPFMLSSDTITSDKQFNLIAAGFGETEPFKGLPSNTQAWPQYYATLSSPVALQTPITFIGKSECSQAYTTAKLPDAVSELESSGYICGGVEGQASLCAGDSGAPLYSINSAQEFLLHGHFEGSPTPCNRAIQPQGESAWVNIPGGYSPTSFMCNDSDMKTWLNSRNMSCVSG